MNVENLVISHENVVFASGREVWVLEAVVRALVPAQDIVAAQATVLEGTVTPLSIVMIQHPTDLEDLISIWVYVSVPFSFIFLVFWHCILGY